MARSEVLAAFPHSMAQHRFLARERHPDAGGSNHQMAELNRARDQALQEIAA